MKLFPIVLLWTWGYLIDAMEEQICEKEYHPSANPRVKPWASNFVDLVQQADVFVDKSLLIKSVLESKPLITLMYPRKWGKTTNIDMLRAFLELEFDAEGKPVPLNSTWGYKYFKLGLVQLPNGTTVKLKKPPLISRHKDIVDKYLGTHPVICMDLSWYEPVGDLLEGFLKAFRKGIGIVYQRYMFLMDALKKNISVLPDAHDNKIRMAKELRLFKEYKRGGLYSFGVQSHDIKEMVKGLEFLSQLLSRHFGKPVFLFIDYYDKMIPKAFFDWPTTINDQAAQRLVTDFYAIFMNCSFENNRYLHTGIVSGVWYIQPCFKHWNTNRSAHYNILNRNIQPFYGFTVSEARQYLTKLAIPTNTTDEAVEWYCGFLVDDYRNANICNPWSIAHFAHSKKFEIYWRVSEEVEILPDLLQNYFIMIFLHAIISRSADAGTDREDWLQVSMDDLSFLKKEAQNIDDANLLPERQSMIIGLYFATGYFTLDHLVVHSPSVNATRKFIKLPNKEMDKFWMDELLLYYKRDYGPPTLKYARMLADGFVKSLDVRSGNESGYEFDLVTDLKNVFLAVAYNPMSTSCDEVEGILFYTLICARTKYGYTIGRDIVYYEDQKIERRLYMTMYNEKHALVFAWTSCKLPRHNSDIRLEARDLVLHEKYFADRGVPFVRYMYLGYDGLDHTFVLYIMNDYYPYGLIFKRREELRWWGYTSTRERVDMDDPDQDRDLSSEEAAKADWKYL